MLPDILLWLFGIPHKILSEIPSRYFHIFWWDSHGNSSEIVSEILLEFLNKSLRDSYGYPSEILPKIILWFFPAVIEGIVRKFPTDSCAIPHEISLQLFWDCFYDYFKNPSEILVETLLGIFQNFFRDYLLSLRFFWKHWIFSENYLGIFQKSILVDIRKNCFKFVGIRKGGVSDGFKRDIQQNPWRSSRRISKGISRESQKHRKESQRDKRENPWGISSKTPEGFLEDFLRYPESKTEIRKIRRWIFGRIPEGSFKTFQGDFQKKISNDFRNNLRRIFSKTIEVFPAVF